MSMQSMKPGWKMVRFGDIVRQCKESVDRDNNPFERYVEGGHMDTENIHIHRWGEFGVDYVGPAFHRIFRKGQVLYGSRRTYLKKVAIAEFDGITANTTFVCESKDQKVFLQELLPFLMLTDLFTEHSIRESKGSTNPYINWSDIAKYELLLPPIEEQKRIAEILWAADDAIEQNYNALTKITSLLAAVRAHHLCKDSYEWATLGDVLTNIVAGKSVIGANEPARNGEYGVLKVSAVGPNGFNPEENKILLDQEQFLKRYQVKSGSLLITRCNTSELVGRVCLTPKDFPYLMLCDKTLELVIDESKASKRFVFEALRSQRIRLQILGCATGTGGAMKNISQKDIRSLKVPVPPLTVQEEVLVYVNAIGGGMEVLIDHLTKLVTLAKCLSESLISGREGVHV